MIKSALCMTTTQFSYRINTMAGDGLMTPGAPFTNMD